MYVWSHLQDSQEFLHSLLEALQSESNRNTSKPVYKELLGKGTEEQQAEEAEAYAR
jgi:ubiquitin C-terminal hydrolase